MAITHFVNVNWKLLIGIFVGFLVIGMFTGSTGQDR